MGFPYVPRAGQEDIIAAVREVRTDHGHLLVDAGTGLGKTACALYGSLDGRPTVYATRTNSQQRQVIQEHRRLRDAGEDPGLLVPFMGRRHYCPLLKDDERFKDGTPDELGRLCRDAKRKALRAHATGKPVKGACGYYERLLSDGTAPVEALLESHAGEPSELGEAISNAGSCPYEALKMLLPQATTVVVPLIFLLDDHLRPALLEWMGRSSAEVHAIFDEGHHLPDAIRAHHSPRLGLATLERAIKEAEELQDPCLAGRVLTTQLLTMMHKIIRDLASEHAPDTDDGWMPSDQFSESLMVRLGTPGPVLQKIALEIEDYGEALRERRRAEGKLPRSYLGTVGSFLRFWLAARDAPYVHVVTREPRPAIEAYLLDPAARSGWLMELASTTHMSGTLAPLASHQQMLGLPQARKLEVPTPFDPSRLKVFSLWGVHRRYEAVQEDPGLTARQQDAARELLAGWKGRMGVFFPSHQMLQDYVEEGFLHGLEATVFEEAQGMDHQALQALLGRFRDCKEERAILLGVLGGRLTEGIDYPGDMLEHMLIMGIPYPRPSARSQALIHHYDRLDGTGWKTIVHDSVGKVLRQTVGRLIRGPDDRGLAVILDDRAVRFHDHLKHLRMVSSTAEVDDHAPPPAEGFLRASLSWKGGPDGSVTSH